MIRILLPLMMTITPMTDAAAVTDAAAMADTVARYTAGLSALENGNAARAVHFLEEALSMGAPEDWTSFHLAEAMEAGGDTISAADLYESISRDGGSVLDGEALAASIRIMTSSGETAAAVERLLALASRGDASSPAALFRAGRILDANGEPDEAKEIFERIVQGFPSSGYAHRAVLAIERIAGPPAPDADPYEVFMEGYASFLSGDHTTALSRFDLLVDRAVPRLLRDDVLYYRGRSLMRRSRYAEALRDYRELRNNHSSSPYYEDTARRILECYLYLGDTSALDLAGRYLDSPDEEAMRLRIEIARTLRMMGDDEYALRLLEDGLGIMERPDYLLEEALILREGGDMEGFNNLASRLIVSFPGSREAGLARIIRAMDAEEADRIDEAIDELTIAAAADDPFVFYEARERLSGISGRRFRSAEADALLALGRDKIGSGDYHEALRILRTVRFGYPGTLAAIDAGDSIEEAVSGILARPVSAIGRPDTGLAGRLETVEFLLAADEREGALDELEEILRVSWDPVTARRRLDLLLEEGRVPEAVSAAVEILERCGLPSDPEILPRDIREALFPVGFDAIMEREARRNGMEPDWAMWAMAVTRVTSRFDPFHIDGSRLGLMGIDAEAGIMIADRMGIGDFGPEDLFDPETNIKIGSRLLLEGIENAGSGRWEVFLTAFSAGWGNAAAWIAGGLDAEDPVIFINSIPFGKTRDFVMEVRASRESYRHIASLVESGN